MNIKIQNIIKEEMVVLPRIFQEIINISSWVKDLEEICKTYTLDEQQINNFQIETFLVLLGLVDKEDYKKNLKENCLLTEEKSTLIVEEVTKKIFKPIAEQLTDKIKKNLPNRPIHWQQNLDFVLSGGDYTAFIREPIKESENKIPEPTPFNPSKLDDLKSKFTI